MCFGFEFFFEEYLLFVWVLGFRYGYSGFLKGFLGLGEFFEGSIFGF